MKYLIVYVFRTKDGISGIGTSRPCTFMHTPPTVEDLRRMEDLIKDEQDFGGVMITGWFPLSEDFPEQDISYKNMTPFKRFLKETLHLYFGADWNGDSFVRAQRLEADLITAKNANPPEVSYRECSSLYPLVQHLIEEMRKTIIKKE